MILLNTTTFYGFLSSYPSSPPAIHHLDPNIAITWASVNQNSRRPKYCTVEMPYRQLPSEPIAVVATSCRFAGGATSPNKLWDLLRQPADLSRLVPTNRFNIHAFYHSDGDHDGTTNASKAYWLDSDYGVDSEYDPRIFDAGFFGIAPKEAEAVDPQQRLLLEAVYEALESAGYPLTQWTGKDVAVYVGAMTADFNSISQRDELSTSPYYATGNARSILANRISYFYDFRGPSVTVDTACSSSLVALHQAVLSLRAGECTAACVAGVNLMLSPEQFLVESSLHMLSPTGHCHMWDSRADGYARGEGVAVFFLKPLSRVLADGDASRIQAIIRETGVGSDGRTAGITMPSPHAQAALIRKTYKRAGLDITNPVDRCQFFEAHGTGTPVGDPREAEAIYTAFFQGVNTDGYSPFADRSRLLVPSTPPPSPPPTAALPLLVGSIKTVVGHTEGAAGLAGVLKVMLAMKHGEVPPNLHFEDLNPSIVPFCTPSTSGSLQVPRKLTAWPAVPPGQPRRASVNSFGFGGTNAHVIVEHYDPSVHGNPILRLPPARDTTLPRIPLLLSAHSATTLKLLASKYHEFLSAQIVSDQCTQFSEVAWQVYMSRTAFPHRLAITASSIDGAIHTLSGVIEDHAKVFGSRATRLQATPRLLGVFTGQGAQWPAMSSHLFRSNSVYRNSVRYMDGVLQACPNPPPWSLETELQKSAEQGSRVGEAAISQPLCTAVQIGVTDVLTSLGIRFSCVIGHSSGEIAAAYAAKCLTKRDAILIAYYRGFSVSSADDGQRSGGMLAAGLSYRDAEAFCRKFRGRLCIAASNSPSSTTLSGDLDAIEEALAELTAGKAFARRLFVDKAYHSHHMTPFAPVYAATLEACQVKPTCDRTDDTVWFSSVRPRGQMPTAAELAGSYWVDNMVKPVLFQEAVESAWSLFSENFDCAFEVGPHPALKGPFSDTVTQLRAHSAPPYIGILQRGRNDDDAFGDFLGFLWASFDPPPFMLQGMLNHAEQEAVSASLSRLHLAVNDRLTQLPSYPWDHSQRYSREPRIVRQFLQKTEPPHELLGVRTTDDIDGYELRWRNILRIDKLPWLAHHSFQGQPLLPASAYCIMALEAARAFLKQQGRSASVISIEDIEFESGIALTIDGPGTEVMLSLVIERPAKDSALLHSHKHISDDLVLAKFSIFSSDETAHSPMRRRCTGGLCITIGQPDWDALPSRTDPSQQPEMFDVTLDTFYVMMSKLGLHYSGPFRALETMQRRNNFASASLMRLHYEDTTCLAISAASLDSCFQVCFATYTSPGDKALWTAFLPTHMKHVTFNMAAFMTSRDELQSESSTDLSVEATLTKIDDATHDHPACVTSDICIYNQGGCMEIQVEGLTVCALAASQVSTDRELYVHTNFAMDPEDSIVCHASEQEHSIHIANDRILDEAVERVTSFYSAPASREWISDSEETLDSFIASSPYSLSLEKVRSHFMMTKDTYQQQKPDAIRFIVEEGHHLHRFQNHVSCIVKQISHRYPRMSVVSFTGAGMGIQASILRGLGAAFISYKSFTASEDKNFALQLSREPSAATRNKVSNSIISRIGDAILAPASENDYNDNPPAHLFDLLVLSTAVFRDGTSEEAILSHASKLLRPGGFLLLVHLPVRLPSNRDSFMQHPSRASPFSTAVSAIITPPDWPDILSQSGFINATFKNADQHFAGGFSITVRQNHSTLKAQMAQLAHAIHSVDLATIRHTTPVLTPMASSDRLLIISGQSEDLHALASHVGDLLLTYLELPLRVVSGLDSIGPDLLSDQLGDFTHVILLADLDSRSPLLSSIDDQRLSVLRHIVMSPGIIILWVTQGARLGNADSAASYGFARSVASEMSSLVLQMLDLHPEPSNQSPPSEHIVASTFLRLVVGAQQKRRMLVHDVTLRDRELADLWTLESEVYMDAAGCRLIPRLLPFQAGNDSSNAARRPVTANINTLSEPVKLVHNPTTGVHEARLYSLPCSSQNDVMARSVITVHYSSSEPFVQGQYVVVGRKDASDAIVAAISESNASFVSVQKNDLVVMGKPSGISNDSPSSTGNLSSSIIYTMAFLLLLSNSDEAKPLVLLAPDDLLVECARATLSASPSQGKRQIIALNVSGSSSNNNAVVSSSTMPFWHLHARATASQLKAALFRFSDGATFVNFLSADQSISRLLSTTLPSDYSCISWPCGLNTRLKGHNADGHANQLLREAVAISSKLEEGGSFVSPVTDFIMSVPAFLRSYGPPQKVLDWRAERSVTPTTHPHTHALHDIKLRGDRSYILVGITRDMGQSLATLFVKLGARYIILASRNAPSATQTPQWALRLMENIDGARVLFEALDVTDAAALKKLHDRITVHHGIPSIGGVVNGAMVLDDHILSHMTADTFTRVMQPKTVGTRNLDLLFYDDDLDFFIMTSSFAAIGGHAGQSNYAAANMFMNGVAMERQRRGLAASVINIGVIYGLGFLHREKSNLYAGLEREGYPPISERDLHHMILEAIAHGRPSSTCSTSANDHDKYIIDLTTGLNRFDPTQSVDAALHWHSDPRFSHHTIDQKDDGTGNFANRGRLYHHEGADDASGNNSMWRLLAVVARHTATADEIADALAAAFSERLATILHLGPVTDGDAGIVRGICSDSSPSELGVDSLVAVETRSWLWRTTGRDVPVMRILGTPSIFKRGYYHSQSLLLL